MKKLLTVLFTVLMCSFLLNAQEMGALKKKVQMMNDEYAKMMLSGDMESMWGSYTKDVISMPSYEPMLKGIDALKESSKKMMESGMKITAFKTEVSDVMKYGDLVVDIGTYKITMEIPGVPEPWSDHGKYMTLWEMQKDGSMKVKVETWNTDTNPWMDMQMMNEGEEDGESMGKPETEEMQETGSIK